MRIWINPEDNTRNVKVTIKSLKIYDKVLDDKGNIISIDSQTDSQNLATKTETIYYYFDANQKATKAEEIIYEKVSSAPDTKYIPDYNDYKGEKIRQVEIKESNYFNAI
jgi:hypothetical protein